MHIRLLSTKKGASVPRVADWYNMCYSVDYAGCHVPWYGYDHCNTDYRSGCSTYDACWTDYT